MNPVSIPEITPHELAQKLEAGETLQIVDVRSPSSVSAGKIEIDWGDRFHNIPGSILLSRSGLDGTGINPGDPTVVVCARGNDSKVVTDHLLRLGVRASSLAGGMSA